MQTLRSLSAVLILALGLTGCATNSGAAPGPSPTLSTTPSTSATPPADPTPVPSVSPSSGPEWPTTETIDCDSMLDAAVDAELRERGLVPAPKDWTQFGFTPTLAAVECPWGVAGSTAIQAYYAWAQFEPGQSEAFVTLVTDNGYAVEESDRGTWLVIPAELEGGGEIAALITEDWVAFANSREQIEDIEWAR
jgi:hypothetical protein